MELTLSVWLHKDSKIFIKTENNRRKICICLSLKTFFELISVQLKKNVSFATSFFVLLCEEIS